MVLVDDERAFAISLPFFDTSYNPHPLQIVAGIENFVFNRIRRHILHDHYFLQKHLVCIK
jgi:hypothetical protein